MVGWIRMPLGMEVGLSSGHTVLDADPALPPPKKGGTASQFSAHVCCSQTAVWIKMPLGTEVGISPGNIVLDGDPVPPPKKGHSSPPTLFVPCLSVYWYRGRPQPRPHCVRWGSSCHHIFLRYTNTLTYLLTTERDTAAPCFSAHFLARSPISATAELFFCLCMIYLRNLWTDLRQIHMEDVFGSSLGRIWRSRSKVTVTRNIKRSFFRPFWQLARGLCLVEHV